MRCAQLDEGSPRDVPGESAMGGGSPGVMVHEPGSAALTSTVLKRDRWLRCFPTSFVINGVAAGCTIKTLRAFAVSAECR